jgi:Mrp family chromosome partitioning ATPase
VIENRTPRHLAERVAAELLPDSLAGLDRLNAAQVRPLRPTPVATEAAGAAKVDVAPRIAPGKAERPTPAVEVVAPRPIRPIVEPIDAGGKRAPGADVISRKTMEEAGMVVGRGRRDQAGEEFRIVREQILQSMAAGGSRADGTAPACGNVVMVTSAKHGEGKSFMALNLANILAEGGDRPVVLIDADIGGNSLSSHFGLDGKPGLLDLAVSPRQLAQAMTIPAESENLTFIPIGGGRDPSARGDMSSRQPIKALVERLADQFRDSIVVIDSPACLSNSDPIELASVVGQIVLVVEAGQTRRRDVEGALDLIDACPNISLVLNRMTKRGRGSFAL